MFSALTKERLKIFDGNLVEVSDQNVVIEEASADGYAKISLESDYKLVVFKKMEKHGLTNIKCKNCADFIVFEELKKGIMVHIFEMKRTVSSKKWNHIKNQFLGAVYNAYALAGVLGELVENNIQFYTCYRRDLMETTSAMRYALMDRSAMSDISEWNGKEIRLSDFQNIKYKHLKIQLDAQSGYAKYKL